MLDATWISPPGFLTPQLSLETQALLRISYGVLLLALLGWTLPHARRFFMSERWGGYAKSSWDVDLVQNPIVLPVVLALWIGLGAALVVGWQPVWVSLLNLLICRYFFVYMRWKGVLRGMGAPGYTTNWIGAAVFFLEYTTHYAPHLRSVALLLVQVDWALIMLSAGIYKFTAGWPKNEGMDTGMCNPEWCYWWKSLMRLPPRHAVFQSMNQCGWLGEVVAAALMFIPQTRFIGGLLITLSFVVVRAYIRLGVLAEMVMIVVLLYAHPGSLLDQWAVGLVSPVATVAPVALTGAAGQVISIANLLLGAFFTLHLLMLPLVHAGLFYNFYGRRHFVAPVQRLLERYSNFFGIIIWRVFTSDLINFFLMIYRRPRDGGEETLVSRWGLPGSLRYAHVGESITVTTLFTTLKYYPSNNALFQERLLRYARTLPGADQDLLVFRYFSVRKSETGFQHVPVAEFVCDTAAGTVEERLLSDDAPIRSAHLASPVHEGFRPGSYAPLRG